MEGNYQINFFRIVFYVSETLFPASDDLPPQSLLHLWEQEYFPGIAQIHMYLYLDFHIAQIHPLPNHMYLYLYIDVITVFVFVL